MSDRARYYLEKCVPELQDLERKKLFDKKEITMIMRRWTDFEHRITSRGSKPMDYLNYAQYEKNLEKLRKLRVKRFRSIADSKPSISDYSASKRIFFIFERGVRKFPKSMELWAAYLKYAKKNGSIKVVYKVYTKLLQLQPRNVNVWLSAAKYEYESNRNVKSARNLFKRCLRFNGDEMLPWLEFIKFEMNYLSKLLVRRKLFSLLTERQQVQDLKENENENETGKDGLAQGDDVITFTADNEITDELNNLPDMNASTLGSIEDNPVLRGDLILTLYDVCVASFTKRSEDKFDKTWQISKKVMELVDRFEGLDRSYLCSHIARELMDKYPYNEQVVLLDLTLPLRYVGMEDEEFVSTLQNSVRLYQSWTARSKADDEVKKEVKREYLTLLRERYLTKAEGDSKELLGMLVKKLE
ncbi:DEKNAAC105243 [Brettanomyces naardenensis]|uniref:DEKNAAC105243 n=1 Tax=Brettanomyces naardenensis TaxID=13370 RepID=A0A448YSP2_BRENA|nr:DEKNAAC105243 [Brettanomyces naardenensis]